MKYNRRLLLSVLNRFWLKRRNWSSDFGADMLGELGCGVDKGGGDGGPIRRAGGAFGKRGAGNEEEYFHKLEREQLKALKRKMKCSIREDVEERRKCKAKMDNILKENLVNCTKADK